MVERRRIAVLLAGGVGERVGLDTPKQLLKISGRTVLEHTLERFQRHPSVDEIVVMMAQGYLDPVHAILRSGSYGKVTQVAEGAETRNGTTYKALAFVPDEADLLLHDAVRPFVSDRVITECFEALRMYAAVDVAIPSADTIIKVGTENTIVDVPPRAELRRGQTPQAFHASVLRDAYVKAMQDPAFQATDDCTVVLRYRPDVPIWIVEGEERNMKITNPIDMFLADKLFQLAEDEYSPKASDDDLRAALEGKSIVVLGGGQGIGADIVTQATGFGATVHSFARSTTGTHVESRTDLAKAADAVIAATGRIDYVVNTAGMLVMGNIADATEEAIFASTEVNYLAPIYTAQVFYPYLKATKGGLLLFTSSSYTRGRQGYSLYSSSKAATANLAQALADEWEVDGIKVNCVNPERTATPMRSAAFGEEPPATLLTSDEVARASLTALTGGSTGHIIDLRVSDRSSSE